MKKEIQDLLDKIWALDKQLVELNTQYLQATNTCAHEWFKTKYGATQCNHCGTYGGWWCPKSPDHNCSYENGDEDSCDWCGNPEERK